MPPPPWLSRLVLLQVLMRTVSIHEQLPGGGDELGPCLLEEVVPYRQFTAQEVDLLATLSGLEVRGAGDTKGKGPGSNSWAACLCAMRDAAEQQPCRPWCCLLRWGGTALAAEATDTPLHANLSPCHPGLGQ